MSKHRSFIGIDGCPSGWATVSLSDDLPGELRLFPHIQDVWEAYRHAQLLLIDMPIGLPEPDKPRRCESEARQFLSPHRTSSIFPVPIRDVLLSTDYGAANQLQKSRTGKGLSRQTWGIVPKIRELDELLQHDGTARDRLHESHPELLFAAWQGHPMLHNKKTEAGYQERLDLLNRLYPASVKLIQQALANTRRSKVARDDIVDALILAVTAKLATSQLASLPANPDLDSTGLPMQIVYPQPFPLQNL
jgi:predicted RNase H-like nuclease